MPRRLAGFFICLQIKYYFAKLILVRNTVFQEPVKRREYNE